MEAKTVIIAPRTERTGGVYIVQGQLCEGPIDRRPAGFMAWVKGSGKKVWEHGETRAIAQRQMEITAKAAGWKIKNILHYGEPV